MKASKEFIKQLEVLFQSYEVEVGEKLKQGALMQNTARTYLLHSGNFLKWCRNEFVPGGRNENK